MKKQAEHPRRTSQYSLMLFVCALVYGMSSGPVLATAFWLRDSTGWDGFYAAMWIYYPLLAFGIQPIGAYLGWWCWLFGTMPPG